MGVLPRIRYALLDRGTVNNIFGTGEPKTIHISLTPSALFLVTVPLLPRLISIGVVKDILSLFSLIRLGMARW
jgi:hypothetical protein